MAAPNQAMQPATHATCVQVHYTGTLEDGSEFDSCLEREPLEFEIGGGKVIPGFDDAVLGLAEGEKRKQLVPAERAYGKCLCTGAGLRPTCMCCMTPDTLSLHCGVHDYCSTVGGLSAARIRLSKPSSVMIRSQILLCMILTQQIAVSTCTRHNELVLHTVRVHLDTPGWSLH